MAFTRIVTGLVVKRPKKLVHSSTEKALVLPITMMLYMVVVTVPTRKLLTMPATTTVRITFQLSRVEERSLRNTYLVLKPEITPTRMGPRAIGGNQIP